MKTRDVKAIILLTTLALIGLIIIQLYWVTNAVALREQGFEQSVMEAMNNVVYKLEKKSIAAKIPKRLKFRKQGIRWIVGKDSLFDANGKSLVDASDQKIDLEKNKYKLNIYEEVVSDSNGVEVKQSRLKSYESDSLAGNKFNMIGQDSTNNLRWFSQRENVVNDIFDELVSVNVYNDYNNNIDTSLVDSLLFAELINKGIDADYYFGIIERKSNVKPVDIDENILNSKFKVNLTPDNIFIQPKYLSVYFPSQTNYILKTMLWMLICSGALILMLISTFYYTIQTIFKQKRLSEIKNDFISNMTHEFKTPISTISLACEVLNDKTVEKSPEKVSNYVGVIKDENKRLGVLVENILQTAILDKGELKLQLETIDLHHLINQCINNLKLQIEGKEGKVEASLVADKFLIKGDKVHLLNVFSNIIDNALKYTLEKPEIKIATSNTENEIMVSIRDNGIGISKDEQKKIFDTLYRVPTGNVHDVKGFGLGLSYVKAIVEMHQGKIAVESNPGKGSNFILTFPFNKI